MVELTPPAASIAAIKRMVARQSGPFKGLSIVADLQRPFNGHLSAPYDGGVSQMSIKRHMAIADATDIVVVYDSFGGSTLSNVGPVSTPFYVRAGFGHIADGDVFQATFNGGRETEALLSSGRTVVSDPIAGSKITAGTAFKLGTFVRTDSVAATASTTNGSNSVTVSSVVGTFLVGQYIVGTGIPANTTITAVSGSTLTLSANATATGTPTVVAYGKWPATAIGYYADGDRMTNSGSGSTTLTTDRTADTSLVTWGAKTTNTGLTAALILGKVQTRGARVMAGMGDSIVCGAGDNTPTADVNTGSYQRLGWMERTFADDGMMILGVGGMGKFDISGQPGTGAAGVIPAHAHRFLAAATGVVFGDGTNDVVNWNASTLTTAMLQARFLKNWRKVAGERALPGWQATILPRVTVTDPTTDAGQTTGAYEGARTAINDWMRDGAPVDATGTAVAVGTTGATIYRCAYMTWNGTTWVTTAGNTSDTTKHPLAGGGVFELADAVETSRNSGKWKRQWEGTVDLNSSTSVTNVTTTAGTFVAGKVISGNAGLPASVTGTLSGATITLSAAATATATAVHIGIALTADGTHPSQAGHDKLKAWLEQPGTDGRTARSIITASCTAPV